MDADQIRIEKIKLKDLDDFARMATTHSAFRAVAPITLKRAHSQSKNPHAHPDDVVLLVAFCENRCVAYHGLLPGLLDCNGNFSKVCWLVTFYVAPNYRGKGIGKFLVEEIQSLNTDLVTTGITKGAERVYRSLGFKQLGELPYIQLQIAKIRFLDFFIKNISESIENAKNKLSAFTTISDILTNWRYRVTKRIFYRAVALHLHKTAKQFKIKWVDQLRDECQNLIQIRSHRPRFFRDVEILNWMLKDRWIVSKQEKEENGDENYYFSKAREVFKYIALEIYSADEKYFKGFMILSISSKRSQTAIKLLDLYFHDPADYDCAAYLGLRYAKNFMADRIEFPEHLAAFFENQLFLKRWVKKKKRLYLYWPNSDESPLAVAADKMHLNYCDSDIAFT